MAKGAFEIDSSNAGFALTASDLRLLPGHVWPLDASQFMHVLLRVVSGGFHNLKLNVTYSQVNGGGGAEQETFVLSSGDWALIPPRNYYQLENISKTQACVIAHIAVCSHSSFGNRIAVGTTSM